MSDPQQALTAYLSLLSRQGADAALCEARRTQLAGLLTRLEGLAPSPDAYRQAVDALLLPLDAVQRRALLPVVREFYYFWLGDIGRIARMLSQGEIVSWRGGEARALPSLDALLRDLPAPDSGAYPPSLGLYLDRLFEAGVDEAASARGSQLLQVLLHLLASRDHAPGCYREAVDDMLTMLADEAERTFFLGLAREYFYWWLKFPAAAQRLADAQP